MTAEIQTLSFITHQLEKLPLKDSGYGSEKCSASFYCRGYGDEKFLKRKRTRTNRVSQQPEDTAAFSSDAWISTSLPFSLEARKEWSTNNKGKQVTEQGSQLRVQTILESSASRQVGHSFSSPNKRKRSTDTTSCEWSPITKFCDEEVKTLCHVGDVKRVDECYGTSEYYGTALFRNDEVKPTRMSPSCFSNLKMQPDLRKWRGRPSINVEQMQRSGFWFPFKSKVTERKVKVIKVSPCDPEHSKLALETYLPDLRESCLFRPIEDGSTK